MGRARLFFVFAAAAALTLVTWPAVGEATASPPARVALRGDTPPVPAHAIALGALAGRTVLHLDVTLKVPDPSALTAFIAAVSDRGSPLFHHFLRPGQFGARFGPTLSEVLAVEASLRAMGLSPGRVTANRLAIPVTATAAVAERAFGVSLERYRLAAGRVAYSNATAPGLPAAVAGYVQGVLGLSNLYREQSLAVRPASPAARSSQPQRRVAAVAAASGPSACAAASSAADEFGSYTADQLASYYAMSPMYKLGDFGQGVRVALAEFEPDSATDIATYESCYGVSTSVSYTEVDGGPGTGSGSGEAALDIEDVLGLAPDVSIDVYQAPTATSTDVYDVYSAIVDADADQVVSTSWGLCELDSDPSLITSEDSLFAQAATQGQTVFAAAGDWGSTGCLQDGTANDSSLSVSDPSSQPYVIGVGGTSIGATAQTVWNDSSVTDGAGGGGLSADWCMPAYQYQAAIPGLVSSDSETESSCGTAVPYVRQVPDVSADADPYTGYTIYYDGSWVAIGGTSAAAPLWAAVAALIDASPFCSDYGSGNAGVQPAGLYAMVSAEHSYIYSTRAEGFYDVTSGNNDYTPSGYTSGLYPATTGYDMASGLGTPLVGGFSPSGDPSNFYPGLAALMCRQYGTKLDTTTITHISPDQGPSAKATTITVTGSGFLPVAGADMAYIGSTQIPAACASTTQCTIRLPAMRPGTVDIQISAEDLTLSAASAASHYRFVAAPAVKSLSPDRGRTAGGTRVTIRGTNFIGVTAVHFGRELATKVRVVSATEIIVTAPSGSGTVTVTVTAAGGTSPGTSASRYRY